MALILNIDTAIDAASVCVAEDGKVLSIAKNEKQKDHAAWLHIAVKHLLAENKIDINNLDAVAVTGGPGSYTGLRIGLAAAKGICYALHKPLINLNTLEVMVNAAMNEEAELFCPMIDARRMEVFTAIYTKDLQIIRQPAAIQLDENSFKEVLATSSICFFGNGSTKFKSIIKNEKAIFSTINNDAATMVSMSERKFKLKEFADLAYAEPLYLKEFYTPSR